MAFRFFHSLEVRYADIDSQRHVNSSCYFSYMEQARVAYIQHLGLWGGDDFDQIGIILLEQSCRYLKAVKYGDEIRVGLTTTRIGTKSMEMEYSIRDQRNEEEYATGRTILVTYDYLQDRSIPVPDDWRQAIVDFEGQDRDG